ncbi:MAG: KOW domain-containing RNA-binding protein [Clostridiales bacterium]|nr:KOW domain-containing RNA-binding protein [Clostridiales bacterium]
MVKARSDIKVGDIVISLAGHDAGQMFVVTVEVNEQFVLIANGKSRPLENPKLKRKRHLRVVGETSTLDSTNASLVKRLKKFTK